MRIFIYKLIISFLAIFFLYHSTIGYTIYKFQNKIYSSLNKKIVEDIKLKIRAEIENSLKKDKILKRDDAILLNKILKKLSSEINSAN
tara:strand:- start:158 stop:421 length:264 start_codon:yes stop_codon:yes gene_type:complete